MWRLGIMAMALAFAGQAQAAATDYCPAYARDFADQVQKQDAEWQKRYDDAEASCLQRFSYDVTTPSKEKPKPKVQKAVSQKPPKAAPAPIAEAATESPAITPSKKPEPGSAAWTAYCQKKYVSFDASKGTYLSKTGVQRKCLVTADDATLSAKASAPAKPKAKSPVKN